MGRRTPDVLSGFAFEFFCIEESRCRRNSSSEDRRELVMFDQDYLKRMIEIGEKAGEANMSEISSLVENE